MIRQPQKTRSGIARFCILLLACLFAATCMAVSLGGCNRNKENEKPSKTIVGLWTDSEQIWIFHSNGTFRVDELNGYSGSSGSWEIENTTLKLHYGFGSTGQDLEIPIKFNDGDGTLTFDGQRKLKRNLEMQQQYNETTGRLNTNLPPDGG